jgi:hypothetical protein
VDWHVKDKLGRESLAFPEFPVDDREGGARRGSAGADQVVVRRSMSQQAEPGNEAAAGAGSSRPSASRTVDDLFAVAALLLMAVATGGSRLSGAHPSKEVKAAVAAARAFGATVELAPDAIVVSGLGTGVLLEPVQPIDLSGAPLTAALLTGLLSSHDVPVTLVGEGVADLSDLFLPIGLQVEAKSHARVSLRGSNMPPPREWQVEVGDLVKVLAILLSAVNTPGLTGIAQEGGGDPRIASLFHGFGAGVAVAETGQGGVMLSITGRQPLTASLIEITALVAV